MASGSISARLRMAECHDLGMVDDPIRSFRVARWSESYFAYRIGIFMTANQVTSRIQGRYYTMFQLKMQVFFLIEPALEMDSEILK